MWWKNGYRTRTGNISAAEKLLKETILTGFREKVFKKKDLEHVNVDTAVQEKNITFPTDAKLYYLGIRILNRYAKKHGVKTKQTYERLKKYIVKGFTMDDERLKSAGGRNYFDELLTLIRDIRSSEKVYWHSIYIMN